MVGVVFVHASLKMALKAVRCTHSAGTCTLEGDHGLKCARELRVLVPCFLFHQW